MRHMIVGAALAALTSGNAPAMAETPADTLVVAAAIDDIITLDPGSALEITSGEILGNTYSRLVLYDLDDPTQLYGDVAESWTVSEDGRVYTFKIKPGLVFASGNPLTAEDVAFSFQRTIKLDLSPAFLLAQLGLTPDNVEENAKAMPDGTFRFVTDKAYAPTFVLNCLTTNASAVVDKKLALEHEENGDFGHEWLKSNYAGSGPMVLREWRANEIVVLERNDNYFGEKAKIARVIYRHVKESATQRLLLESGDVDIARNLEPGDLATIAEGDDIDTTSILNGSIFYISLNLDNEYLAKPEIREAFKYLIDYDAIEATLINGIGEIHQAFLPKGILGAVNDNPYKLDVEKAKALLAEVGYPDGFTVTFDVRTTQPVASIAESIQQTAAEAGITLEIIPGTGKQTLTKYRARNHDIYIGDWGIDYWDPHGNAQTYTNNPDPNNPDAQFKTLAWRNGWDVPELTAKTEAAVMESDTAKRVELYEELQKEALERSPIICIYQQKEVAAFNKKVENFRLGATSHTNYLYLASKS
jgi:peptide/nickel transport system substrate-binding protein